MNKKCRTGKKCGTGTPARLETQESYLRRAGVPVLLRNSRRDFLCITAAAGLAALWPVQNHSADAAPCKRRSLDGVVGITTGGGLGLKAVRGELTLLTLPKYMREKLGMKLIDVNTRWFKSYNHAYLQRVRHAADAAGCYFTNLKVNHSFGDLYSRDADERQRAMSAGRQLIDAAQALGTRWIRFVVPKAAAANPVAHLELAVYAESHAIQLLVENAGWIKLDPDGIVSVVKAIGRNVAPCPDTGNWSGGDVRQRGLRNSFPGAASCDFKVWELDADHRHARYDLKQCFDIGWKAGFRGPWVIEHMRDDNNFARDTIYIRDLLTKWINQNKEQTP